MAELERVLAAFDADAPPRDGTPSDLAAVLLALFDTGDGPALLYTRRSDAMRSHPGEISFPGGRVDAQDASPLDAALREAEEEVGLLARDLDRPRHIADYETFRGTTVCCYVALARAAPPTLPRSMDEVAEVFLVPVRGLLDPQNYEARRLDGMPPGRQVHYWHLEGRIMWGITGEITAMFLKRAYAWTPPRVARTVEDVSDLVPRRIDR